MRLKSFRIFRYKSIIDSGECVLAPDFTILIGKNESGKSAVLEALRDFDREQHGISPQAVSINGMHAHPELELTFAISAETLNAALKESGVSMPEEVRLRFLSGGITLRKNFEGEYRFHDGALDALFGDVPQAAQADNDLERITARKQRLGEILDVHPVPEINFGQDMHALQESINNLRRLVRSRLNFINDEAEKVEAVEILHAMTSSIGTKVKPVTPRDKFIQTLVRSLPRFIYFSDFKDILPFEISIDALKTNQTVCDFATIAQLDLDDVIATQDIQRRINLLNRASAKISGEFFDHWEQDRIELIARPEGNKVLFGVKEQSGTDLYKMEQRSRGFQWFLSFYLRINRYQSENVVFLIDEPGMNLHPTAQKNILTVMAKRSSPSMQIIFSTHSPSLIDIQKLERVRCIVKSKVAGSVIIKKVTDAVDYETLMPVAAAAGVNSIERLKPIFSGEKTAREAQPTAVFAANEARQPAASSTVNAPSQEKDFQVFPSEPVAPTKPISTKIDKDEDEQGSEYASRKPIFKLFGK